MDEVPPNTERKPRWTYQGYQLEAGNFATALVHLYRAEVSRTNLWRGRLDTTTNWAVVTTAGALTFSFTSSQNPHFVLLLVMLLVLVFLNIEARRYSYYALWYHRVHLLETDFFAAMLAPPFKPTSDWGHVLSDTLLRPAFPIPRWEALANRYRRHYIGIVTLLLLSWLLKLAVHPTPTQDIYEVVRRAAIGPVLPGPWVAGTVLGIYVLLFLTMLTGYLRFKRRESRPKVEGRQRGPRWYKPETEPNLAIVITKQKEAVAQRLMTELGRGVTAVQGTGMYTGTERDVLLCAVTDVQVGHLQDIVRAVDEQSFVVVARASDVRGGHFAATEPPS
jgi:uncharacterized membrane protein